MNREEEISLGFKLLNDFKKKSVNFNNDQLDEINDIIRNRFKILKDKRYIEFLKVMKKIKIWHTVREIRERYDIISDISTMRFYLLRMEKDGLVERTKKYNLTYWRYKNQYIYK